MRPSSKNEAHLGNRKELLTHLHSPLTHQRRAWAVLGPIGSLAKGVAATTAASQAARRTVSRARIPRLSKDSPPRDRCEHTPDEASSNISLAQGPRERRTEKRLLFPPLDHLAPINCSGSNHASRTLPAPTSCCNRLDQGAGPPPPPWLLGCRGKLQALPKGERAGGGAGPGRGRIWQGQGGV